MLQVPELEIALDPFAVALFNSLGTHPLVLPLIPSLTFPPSHTP